MKTIDLRFDTSAPCSESPPVADGEDLLNKALALQYRWIRIDWDGIVQLDLPVEDDVTFLAMAYAELEESLKSGQTHNVFLGDGLLVVSAECEGETVTMTVVHTPHLDRRFSESKAVKVPLSKYRQAWGCLMNELARQVHAVQ
jgi:hypothetical protein